MVAENNKLNEHTKRT